MHDPHITQLTAHLFREEAGKITAVLTRLYGMHHIDHAMDVVQETFETALRQWKFGAIPGNPSAWLMRVARNKMVNVLKRSNHTVSMYFEENPDLSGETHIPDSEINDSRLSLLVTLCSAGLSVKNSMIITLYLLCGFGVPEIANALLMQEEAVKKAITRCKAVLKEQGKPEIHFSRQRLQQQLPAIMTILYVTFNEGYKTTRQAEGINIDLCYEAIRLTRLILEYDTTDPALNALLALMFFNAARFPARLTVNNEWVTLQEQDRSLWNQQLIKEGWYYLNKVQPATLNKYYLEALISSIHCTADTYKATDWKKIVFLYEQLERTGFASTAVSISKIIAESHYYPLKELIKQVDQLFDEKANDYFSLYLCKAYLQEAAGDLSQAKESYNKALSLSKSAIDRRFIVKKIMQCHR